MDFINSIQEKTKITLKSLEPYTKTDMVYLAKGGFWLGIGQAFSTMSAFITSLAFANLLDPDVFGIYKYIMSVTSLLLISSLSGMDSAVTQSISRGYDGTLNEGLNKKFKWSLIGTVFSFMLSIYYLINGNNILSICFGITAVFIPFVESFDIYNSLLWGKKLFNIQTNYNVIKKVISLALILLTVVFTKNIYLILVAYFISIVIPNYYFLIKTKEKYSSNNNVDPEAVNYGKKLSWVYIVNNLLSELDKILIFQHIGASNLASYSMAVAPTDQIKGLLKNVNSLAMPQFSQRSISDIKKNIKHKVLILTTFIVVLVSIYILLSPLFFKIFFPKYLISIKYSQILSISLIPVVISGFLYTILEAQKTEKEIYQFNIISNIFGIIILFPFVYYLGIWGAITARTITRTFGMFLSIYLINKIN